MTPIGFGTLSAGQVGSATSVAGDDTSNVDQDTNLVPDPINQLLLGDGMERIAALLIKSFRDDRRMSKSQERLQEQLIMKEAKARVQEMRNQAKEIAKSAWRSGLGQMASGGLTIGSAIAPSKADAAATQGEHGLDATAANKAVAKSAENGAEKASLEFDWSAGLKGSAKVSEGLGTWASGACDSAAKDHEASAAEHDAAKEAATRRADQVHNETKDIEEMLDRVVEFLEKVSEGQQKATQAAIMRA